MSNDAGVRNLWSDMRRNTIFAITTFLKTSVSFYQNIAPDMKHNVEDSLGTQKLLAWVDQQALISEKSLADMPAAAATSGDRRSKDWRFGLCNRDDLGYCLCAFFFMQPAVACALSEFNGSNFLFDLPCVTPCVALNQIRTGYGIEGSCLGDCCVLCLCPTCAVARMWREVNFRGGLPVVENPAEEWQQSLVGCCDYPCCCLFCGLPCPGVVTGCTQYYFDDTSPSFSSWCVGPVVTRNIIRRGYHIPGTCCEDTFIALCLPVCSAMQLWGEVKRRGPVGGIHGSTKAMHVKPATMT